MKRVVLGLAVLALLSAGAGQLRAAVVGFAANPTTNSTDFTSHVAGQGGTVTSNLNFNTHPTGSLQPNFYLLSDGVTLTPSGSFNNVVFGTGPNDGNIFTGPLSPGEGAHAPSNYLRSESPYYVGPSSLTISFANPVGAVGLFTIDHFNPAGHGYTNTLFLDAYSGANGTGTLLGSVSSVAFNFQPDNLYFMGLASTLGNDIGSVVFRRPVDNTGDTIGVDNIMVAQLGSTTIVPEPATLTLLSIGAVCLGAGALRRKLRKQVA